MPSSGMRVYKRRSSTGLAPWLRPSFSFRPRLLDELRNYDKQRFGKDLAAGVTVGVVALPLAMAFAVASGVKPEAGLFTAIIGGFLVAALGGSRVQIGGPAGAFIVIVYGIVERFGFANLLIATAMAGILLFLMGLFRLGNLIRLIPVPIVIGFTNGIAVLIALSQLKDFFGLDIAKLPSDFFANLATIGGNLHTVNPYALGVASVSLALVAGWPKLLQYTIRRCGAGPAGWLAKAALIPGSIVALVAATAAVRLLNLPVETIGSQFGGIPQGLPTFAAPPVSWELAKQLVGPTLTIALLAAIESLLCARIADTVTEDRHDPNQELMAQGAANFVVPFFGGIPVTGTIARTMTNVRSGATSPVSGMIHAATLLIIVLVAAPLASSVPLAALAAILLFVAYNMGEWKEFRKLGRFSLNYRIIMVATFLLTVVFDLTVAVEVGLVLASLFFIYRISTLTRLDPIDLYEACPSERIPVAVSAYQIFGSLFFGSVSKLEALIDPQQPVPEVLILDLHRLINMDTTGLEALSSVHKWLRRHGSQLVIVGASEQPDSLMKRAGFAQELGAENYLPDLRSALQRTWEIYVLRDQITLV
jgi:SulP family sulfate permease